MTGEEAEEAATGEEVTSADLAVAVLMAAEPEEAGKATLLNETIKRMGVLYEAKAHPSYLQTILLFAVPVLLFDKVRKHQAYTTTYTQHCEIYGVPVAGQIFTGSSNGHVIVDEVGKK